MERSHGSDKRVACKEAVCSLLILALGVFSCLLLATLAFFTYQSIVRHVTFCNLWIDVPGRLVIFVIFYFIASVCGFLPLPESCRLSNFIQPFPVWRLESWRHLFRNIFLLLRSRSLMISIQRDTISAEENPETPLLQENGQEHSYGYLQRRSISKPINIPYPQSYVAPVFVSNPEITPRDEIQMDQLGSGGPIASIDFLVGDIAVPTLRRKRPMLRYLSEAGIGEYESPEDEVKISSKYRKRYNEPKWPEGSITNTLKSVPGNRSIIVERSEMLTLDKKSTALADHEQRADFSERRTANEMPKGLSTKQLASISLHTFSRDTSKNSLDEKPVTLVESERFVSTTHQGKPKPMTKMSTAHAVDSLQIFKIKSPPKYRERYPEDIQKSNWTGKEANIPASKPDQSFTPTANERPLNETYFQLTDNERLSTIRQPELQRSGNGNSKLCIADAHEVAAGKYQFYKLNEQQRIHRTNRQHGGETSKHEQETLPKYCNTEAQINFPELQNRNQQSRGASASSKLGSPAKSHDIDTSWNFPRFPWKNLRDPRGISALANKLHKKNLELEKREMKKILINHRKQDKIDILRSRLGSYRRNRISETQLLRSSDNSLIARSSFGIENVSAVPANSSSKQIKMRTTTESNLNKDNASLTMNRYNPVQEKVMKYESASAIKKSSAVFSERTYVESPDDNRAMNQRRQLPSQRFPIRSRTQPQILNKTEEIEFKLEIHKKPVNKKDSGRKTLHEEGPSIFFRFEKKGPGASRPVSEINDSFNNSQLDHLKRRLEHFEQGKTQTNIENFGVTKSKQNSDTNTRAKTIAASEKVVTECNVSKKPSETDVATNSDIKIPTDFPLNSSDDDKDTGQSRK